MSNKPPAFQMYAADFDLDTNTWTNEEVGLYLRLLLSQWVNGPLVNDPVKLAKIGRISRKKFSNLFQNISHKFISNGEGKIQNQRLEKEREKQLLWREKSRLGGLSSGKSRQRVVQPPLEPPLEPKGQPKGNSSSSSSSLKNKHIVRNEETYKTKKGRVLGGPKLVRFEKFWKAFDYKQGRAEAADVWLDLEKNLSEETYNKIIQAAQQEAKRRPGLVAKGSTPKMAQGWLSAKRWEDEEYTRDPEGSKYAI